VIHPIKKPLNFSGFLLGASTTSLVEGHHSAQPQRTPAKST
jgi:hypothetical protein